jgi:molybdopterin-guanine dinucleotide biosynthesis protein A
MIAAAILAGGQGLRMGGAVKPLLVVEGERIIDRQLGVLRQLVDEIVISANNPAPFFELGLPVWADEAVGQGPLAGLCTVLENTAAEHVLVVAGDMPDLAVEPLALLLGAPEADIVAPRGEPLCARYARRIAPRLRERLAAGKRRMMDLLVEPGLVVIEMDFENRGFLRNLNTPEDLPRL